MRRTLILLAALVSASPAFAGMRAVYSLSDDISYVRGQNGGNQPIEIADNGDVRITDPNGDYSLLLGNTLYVIEKRNGAWRVARAADRSVAFKIALMSPPSKTFPLTDSEGRWRTERRIVKRGETQVNGRIGTIYETKPHGQDKPRRCVVSSDPALAPIGSGMARVAAARLATLEITSAEAAADTAAQMRIYEQGTILQCGQLRLLHAETVTIDRKRFALPAEPKTIPQLIEDLQAEYPPPPHGPPEGR